jgi:hypothetical protein
MERQTWLVECLWFQLGNEFHLFNPKHQKHIYDTKKQLKTRDPFPHFPPTQSTHAHKEIRMTRTVKITYRIPFIIIIYKESFSHIKLSGVFMACLRLHSGPHALHITLWPTEGLLALAKQILHYDFQRFVTLLVIFYDSRDSDSPVTHPRGVTCWRSPTMSDRKVQWARIWQNREKISIMF